VARAVDHHRALRSVLGEPAWATDPALDSAAGRHAGHDLLDEQLAAWAAGQVVEDAVDRLVALGVPAEVGWDPRVASRHPQLVARGLYELVPHKAVGEHPVPGLPLRWSGIDRWNETPSPLLGEHNREVLSRILGLTEPELDALEAAGVTGTSASS
jgi:crotonobetainyl-CoA:carnitine CoA-transferase CaiB-like acyl-CoA transferase